MERRVIHRETKPASLERIRAASEALKGVDRACDITHAKPEFIEFIRACSPASVIALLDEHAALIEQRNLLVAALRPFAALDIDAFDHLRYKPDDWNVYQMNETMVTLGDVRRARNALATAEQGHEEQAKGGSGGEG